MPGPRPNPRATLAPAAQDAHQAAGDRWRSVLLGTATALLSARILYPSESATVSGDGIPIVCLQMLLLPLTWLLAGSYLLPLPRWQSSDLGALLFAAVIAAASLYGGGLGPTRAGINALWEWLALCGNFLLFRQLLRTPAEARALCVALLAVAMTQVALANFQYWVEKPRAIAFFEQNPDEALFEAGVYAPEGSALRYQFAQRLKSREPEGSFALTNNLAGFLLPLLILTAGEWAQSRPSNSREAARASTGVPVWLLRGLPSWTSPAWLVLPLGGCLWLTHSRGAILAATVCLAGLACTLRFRWTLARFAYGMVPIAATGIVAGFLAAKLGAANLQPVRAALRSLLFRGDYWQASAAMLGDYLWLGCGPGRFQEAYTQYRLPRASEVIADPHNFLVEIFATGGVLAGGAFLIWMASLIFTMANTTHPAQQPESPLTAPPKDHRAAPDPQRFPRYVLVGACSSYLLAMFVNPLASVQFDEVYFWLGCALASLVCLWLGNWVSQGRLSAAALRWSALAMLIHMSVSAGISLAALAGPLVLLVVICLAQQRWNEAQTQPAAKALPADLATLTAPRWRNLLLGGCTLALPVAAYFTAFLPNTMCQSAIKETRLAVYQSKAQEAEARLRAAVEADPLSADAARLLADVTFQAWLRAPSPDSLARFEADQRVALARAPRQALAHAEAGKRRLLLFRRINRPQDLESARQDLRTASALFPTDTLTLLESAWLEHLAGGGTAARQLAERALALDAGHDHVELKLATKQLTDPTLPEGATALQIAEWLQAGGQGALPAAQQTR